MKRRLYILLCVIMLNLTLVGNVFATDTMAGGDTNHTGWSTNWGIKTFTVHTTYVGNQYDQSGKQYVDGHDYIVYIVSPYPPEISRGAASILGVNLVNTSGSVISTLSGSNFSNGLYRSYVLPIPRTSLIQKVSYNWLMGVTGVTYRIKAQTLYTNPEFVGMAGTDTYYTPYF